MVRSVCRKFVFRVPRDRRKTWFDLPRFFPNESHHGSNAGSAQGFASIHSTCKKRGVKEGRSAAGDQTQPLWYDFRSSAPLLPPTVSACMTARLSLERTSESSGLRVLRCSTSQSRQRVRMDIPRKSCMTELDASPGRTSRHCDGTAPGPTELDIASAEPLVAPPVTMHAEHCRWRAQRDGSSELDNVCLRPPRARL